VKATLYVPAGTTVEVLDQPTEPTEPTEPGTYTPAPESYRIWHNGTAKTGPSSTNFNSGVSLRWRNLNGDWLDRDGTEQGAQPWHVLTVPKRPAGDPAVQQTFDVTALAEHWRTTRNTGGMLLVPTSNNAAAWVRFAGSATAQGPVLTVTFEDGTTRTMPVDMAGFTLTKATASSPAMAVDSSATLFLSPQTRGMIHCHELRTIAQPITHAALTFTVLGSDDKYDTTLQLMQTDAPPLLVGGAGHAPTMGLAAEVGSEDALASHPDVFAAGDFRESNWSKTPGVWSDNLGGDVFSGGSMTLNRYQRTQVVADPDYPGRYYLDTCVPTGNIGGGEMFCSIGARADETDPARPIISADVVREAYVRVEVWLDQDSFWSSNYAFKFSPVGWTTQHGLWRDDKGGGWNSKGGSIYVFGSGQTSSDGRKSFDSKYQQWLYKGHSMRGHTVGWPHRTATVYPDVIGLGFAPSHLGPYEGLWDGGTFGTEQCMDLFVTEPNGRIRQHVIPKGRWVTMESRIKLNTVDLSNPDAFGNGEARNDGIYQTWLDGVLVGERTTMAWTRHPDIGVRSPWLMVYHGGGTKADHDIRVRFRNFVVAKRYIGPAVA
jgi:hypothetical protein